MVTLLPNHLREKQLLYPDLGVGLLVKNTQKAGTKASASMIALNGGDRGRNWAKHPDC